MKKISDFYDFAPSFLSQKWGLDFGNLEKRRQKTENRGFQVKFEDFGGWGRCVYFVYRISPISDKCICSRALGGFLKCNTPGVRFWGFVFWVRFERF